MNTENHRIKNAMLETLGASVVALLDDDSVIEIMRNANGVLCVERLGSAIEESQIKLSDRATETFIRLLASLAQELCNDRSPSLAMKLPYWHARFQGLLPPLVESPSFSIRKHRPHVYDLEHYVRSGQLKPEHYECLIEMVAQRQNIIIAGGTGSGKTTFANALLQKMAAGDRIITIEDTPELILQSKTGLQIITKSSIGYDARAAIRDTLRLRPDRIVLGELRDGACLDLIKAWNTGHAGGLTTLHANSCELALMRVESLIAEVSVNIPRELIAQTVHAVVYIERSGARRVVTDIKKIIGLENHTYRFCEIRGDHAKPTSAHRTEHDSTVIYLS
jgi:P-type conjugative transfer ATPase TrbB